MEWALRGLDHCAGELVLVAVCVLKVAKVPSVRVLASQTTRYAFCTVAFLTSSLHFGFYVDVDESKEKKFCKRDLTSALMKEFQHNTTQLIAQPHSLARHLLNEFNKDQSARQLNNIACLKGIRSRSVEV